MDELAAGRAAYDGREWAAAEAALGHADARAPLAPADVELFAITAYMLGDHEAFFARLERAHQAHVERGDALDAFRCAHWIGMTLLVSGDFGRGGGWLARAQRLLEGQPDCVERVWVRVPEMFEREARGDLPGAIAVAGEIVAGAQRYGDRDLFGLAMHSQGDLLIRDGQIDAGLRTLDEAMLAVASGELSPIVSGIVYCGTILACQAAHEVRRAAEWTDALTRWCDEQPDMLAFTGACRVHRAELMQLRGAWTEAMAEAQRAADNAARLGHARSAGEAAYVRGELHRLRGQLAPAEKAYREASGHGREPQPGLALLRVAEGDAAAAAAAMRRMMGETTAWSDRARLLPGYVEVMLAAGGLDDARTGAQELRELAATCGTEVVAARAAHAEGAVALAAGDATAALPSLRRSAEIWQALAAPYDAARTRVLVGQACGALGDDEAAALALEDARETFAQLGADADAAAVDLLLGRRTRAEAHGLSPREIEVLRLVAGGASNKAIAAELVLSDRTVDRHVSNILAKLRVSSRAAATAYAYEHKLL